MGPTSSPPTITRLSGTLGARVDGVDVANLDDDTFELLQVAFLAHQVLVLPDQDLTPEDEVAFARRWGTIWVHPQVPSLPGHPEVLEVVDPTHPIARTWHQDQTFVERPPLLTMLYPRVLPDHGGDTMFADQHAAWEALSPGLRASLGGLAAVHERSGAEATHPVAPHHPVTGRRALFVNADYTVRFDGWTAAESRGLLAHLFDVASRPERTCRHRWSPGDLVVWDNRNVAHCVVADASGDRVLHKVTVEGERPR